ncbi:hypothetical protein [Candidatus Poriferisodalis sp.]|uniref:hypothetical protein n=1 Tax=Candidatus Poriferisodalis sp. TaxID=3101277 RepID=UPI003C704E23
MDSEEYNDLYEKFLNLDETLVTSAIIARLEDLHGSLTDGEAMLDALLGACLYDRRTTQSRERVASDIAQSDVLDIQSSSQDILAERLVDLFETPVLRLLAHAASLRAEDDRLYCTSRILSDLRPLFSKDKDAEPIAALIRHTLRFNVHENGRIESIQISIGGKALAELKEAIERALQKSESLAQIARAAELMIVEHEETH